MYQFERLTRKLYYYQREVGEMRQQNKALRDKNEQLIYNILPAYVASDFIGSNKKDEVGAINWYCIILFYVIY